MQQADNYIPDYLITLEHFPATSKEKKKTFTVFLAEADEETNVATAVMMIIMFKMMMMIMMMMTMRLIMKGLQPQNQLTCNKYVHIRHMHWSGQDDQMAQNKRDHDSLTLIQKHTQLSLIYPIQSKAFKPSRRRAEPGEQHCVVQVPARSPPTRTHVSTALIHSAQPYANTSRVSTVHGSLQWSQSTGSTHLVRSTDIVKLF